MNGIMLDCRGMACPQPVIKTREALEQKPASVTASASNADLADGKNWNIINDGTTAIPHKAIALAKILSKG